jgi:hypothetical protein
MSWSVAADLAAAPNRFLRSRNAMRPLPTGLPGASQARPFSFALWPYAPGLLAPCYWLALAAVFIGPSRPAAGGGRASVHFDVSNQISCRDVTPPEFAEANPNERLVQVQFQVSSLIRDGRESDLIQYLYFLESPERALRIVDYSPQTTLATGIAGNVGIEKKQEKTRHLGITFSGQHDPLLKASGGGDLGAKSNSTVHYELLPQMELLAASGTVKRGSGVYFKLRPSPQTSLEGSKDFSLVLRAPAVWRGDYVCLYCSAIGFRRGVIRPLDEEAICGKSAFIIALYAEGDEEAKAAAQRFVLAEARLRRLAASSRDEIARRSYPTLVHKVGAMLEVVGPRIPEGWLPQLLYGPAQVSGTRVAEKLPSPLRTAVREYVDAKLQLHQLNGRGWQMASLSGAIP